MEAAVRIQNLSGCKVQQSAGSSSNAVSYICRLSKPLDWRNAVIDQFLILFHDTGSHVGLDNAGPYLKHRDTVFRQAISKQLRGHGDAGLGHAVFPRLVEEVYADMEEILMMRGL